MEDLSSATGLRTYLGNIPGVRARGVELEANYAATRKLKLILNASFNRATYLDFTTAAPDTSVPILVNFSRRQLHDAPKVIVHAGIDFAHPVGRYPGRYELLLAGKNLLIKEYATGAGTFGGSGAITSQPGYDRTFAAVFRAKL